jgi:hypothetical protein
LALTLSMVSLLSTSRVMVFPVSVFTKICISSSMLRSLAPRWFLSFPISLAYWREGGASRSLLRTGGREEMVMGQGLKAAAAAKVLSLYSRGGHAHPAA